MRLQNKVILVTGSCSGIGHAIAARCVREGARVILHGLESELARGEAAVAELGPEVAAVRVEDLTNEGCAERLVAFSIDHFGRLDGVVNNAALVATGQIAETDLAYFRRMLEINTLAPYALIRAALPELQKNQGSILNIGSVNAWCGEPDLLPYSVSKGALMTMTRNLGDVLLREAGVCVNQINPGWVLTENENRRKLEQGLGADWERGLPKSMAPSGRILRPAEIAEGAAYLLSDDSGPISGQVIDLEQYPMIGRGAPKDGEALG